jgi:hypothetical protein
MRIRGSGFSSLTWVGFCLAFLCTHSAAQQPPAPQPATPNIQINVNRVLVPVVVRDKQGRTVDNLKQEDFQVLDEGKPRPVSGFTVQRRGANESAAANTTETGQSSPAPANAAPQSSMLPDRITVFLFDDMHLSPEDLSYARQAAIKALDSALTGSDVAAVVSTSGKTNSGLTRDRAILQNAIAAVQLHGTNQFEKSDCPYISYYQADLILNEHDNHAVQDALAQVLNCDPGINAQTDLPMAQRLAEQAARRALSAGEHDTQANLCRHRGDCAQNGHAAGAALTHPRIPRVSARGTRSQNRGIPAHRPCGAIQRDDQRSGCARIVHNIVNRQ